MHSDTYATEQNGNPYQKKKSSLKVKSGSITIALTSAHLPASVHALVLIRVH